MNFFRIYRNDKDDFILTEQDFRHFCEQYILEISEKLGAEPFKLPDSVDDADFMQLNEVDELLQYHFTYKLLAREYGFEIPDEMHEIENFISELLILALRNK